MLESLRSLLSRKKAGREAVAGVGEVTVTTGAALGSGDTKTRAGRSCRWDVANEDEDEGKEEGGGGGAGADRGGLEKEKKGSPEVE